MTYLRFPRPDIGYASPLQSWQRFVETRRARRRLMELDDHLLKDIGLTRADARFGDLESFGQQHRERSMQ